MSDIMALSLTEYFEQKKGIDAISKMLDAYKELEQDKDKLAKAIDVVRSSSDTNVTPEP